MEALYNKVRSCKPEKKVITILPVFDFEMYYSTTYIHFCFWKKYLTPQKCVVLSLKLILQLNKIFLFCHTIYDFLNFQKNAYDYEHSELLLYQNMVMQESGDYAGALAHLDKYEVKF